MTHVTHPIFVTHLTHSLLWYEEASLSIQPFGHKTLGEKWEAAVPSFLGAGSPSNTMWPGPRPNSMPNFILIHPIFWPQYTNVTDRQDNGPIACRTVLQTVAEKRLNRSTCRFGRRLGVQIPEREGAIFGDCPGHSKALAIGATIAAASLPRRRVRCKRDHSVYARHAQIGIPKMLGAGDASYRPRKGGDRNAQRGRSLISTIPLFCYAYAVPVGDWKLAPWCCFGRCLISPEDALVAPDTVR